MMRRRDGVTLLELMVALAILALMAGVTVAGLRRAGAPTPPTDADRITNARRDAIALGRPVHFLLRDSAEARPAHALPDGRVLGAPSYAHGAGTGEANHATR
jgi:prepilin-type N-terminal cleavage/methylation domain-containing protein